MQFQFTYTELLKSWEDDKGNNVEVKNKRQLQERQTWIMGEKTGLNVFDQEAKMKDNCAIIK